MCVNILDLLFFAAWLDFRAGEKVIHRFLLRFDFSIFLFRVPSKFVGRLFKNTFLNIKVISSYLSPIFIVFSLFQ